MTASTAVDRRPTAALRHSEHGYTSFDGTRLFYRAWHPGRPRPKALILFHGGHEHSGRFHELVQRLALDDVSVFAWDARGHGRSPGRRGDARHFNDLVRDADRFLAHIHATYGIAYQDMALLGHSVGSVIAASWLHDYGRGVRAAVLGSPAFNVKLYAPFALPALRLWQRIRPNGFVNSYVRPGMLTHDQAEADARRRDPLISPAIAVRVLTSLFDTAERVIAGAASITTPVLLLSAERDWVVQRSAQRRFFQNLGSARKHFETLEGFYHEVFHERDRHRAIDRARRFLVECYAAAPPRAALRPANEATYRALARPLPQRSAKALGYALARAGLRSIGRLSEGVRLGLAHGFDSGPMLDYVYRNRARGLTPLGRAIDRAYLDAPGWRGIRQRGEQLQQTLAGCITELRDRGRRVHVADLASGPGAYLLRTLQALDDPGVSAVCRDRDGRGLAEGRRLAERWQVARVDYQPGDAFDPAGIESLDPRPDIVVVSGLYELFPGNAMVAESLAAIRRTLAPGGYLIVTNQPRHPQLEFIARALTNREQRPWVMRPRSQSELVSLAARAGFTPRAASLCDQGIFSVNVFSAAEA